MKLFALMLVIFLVLVSGCEQPSSTDNLQEISGANDSFGDVTTSSDVETLKLTCSFAYSENESGMRGGAINDIRLTIWHEDEGRVKVKKDDRAAVFYGHMGASRLSVRAEIQIGGVVAFEESLEISRDDGWLQFRISGGELYTDHFGFCRAADEPVF